VNHAGANLRHPIIGVMGPGASATERDARDAFRLGELLAAEGWVVLSGGRNRGVMDAVSRGARHAGGLVVGVLPGATPDDASDALDVAIVTGMGEARNNVNVLSSSVVVACGMCAGTASEVALAIKAGKRVVLLGASGAAIAFFRELDDRAVAVAATPDDAVAIVRSMLHP